MNREYEPQAIRPYEDPYDRPNQPIVNPQVKSPRTLTHLERYVRREGARVRDGNHQETGRLNIDRPTSF